VVPVGEVERAMRGLDRAALLAFVAEAWAARGRETAVVDGVVLAREPTTGVERRVAVAPARGGVLGARLGRADRVDLPADADADAGVDAVVTPAPERVARRVDGDVRVLGPAAVRDLLRHGLDASTGERLARRHLGVDLEVERGPRLDAPDGGGLTASFPGGPPVLAAVLVVLALVAGGVVVAWPGGSEAGTGERPAASEYTVVAPSTPEAGEPLAASEYTVVPPAGTAAATRGSEFPPGLGPGGVENLTALLEGHRERVVGRPYAFSMTFRGTTGADGTRWADARTSVRVRSESVYRYRQVGVPEGRVGVGAASATNATNATQGASGGSGTAGAVTVRGGYADGEVLYLRDGDDYDRRPLPASTGASRFADRVEGFLRVYLSTNRTSVTATDEVAGGYRVVATGRPSRLVADDRIPPGGDDLRPPFEAVRNYTAVAVVTRQGLVRELRVAYERPDGVEAAFALTYVSVGSLPAGPSSVEPPSWYEAALAATGDGRGADDDDDRNGEAAAAAGG
jgi:hypothetical protein